MSDPIDELSRFGAEFTGTGGDMSRSAADVRRRGDQIRRRRTALVAGASALAVAAVAIPILAIAGGNPKADRRDDVADDRTGALSTQNLISDDDTVYNEANDWFTNGTLEGEGAGVAGGEPFNLCARADLSDLGATAVFDRGFALAYTGPDAADITPDPARDELNKLRETIAEFPNAAAAAAAYDTVTDWLVGCKEHLAGSSTPDYSSKQTYPVVTGVPGDSSAQIVDASYGPVPIDQTGDEQFIAETGLVRVGNRIAVLASVIVGQDYNFDTTPVAQMIPSAADRLQPGAKATKTPEPSETETGSTGAPDPGPGGSSSDSAVNPAIADDFPLATGWPAVDGIESKLMGPNRTLAPFTFNVCGADVDVPEPQDRLKAEWSQPEDGRNRQLSTYATADEASAALNAIVTAYRNCPQEPGNAGETTLHTVVQGSVGGESWIIGNHYEVGGEPAIGLETIYLIRLGLSVLFINSTGEGSAPDPVADITTAGKRMATEAADVIAEMCVFTEAGC